MSASILACDCRELGPGRCMKCYLNAEEIELFPEYYANAIQDQGNSGSQEDGAYYNPEGAADLSLQNDRPQSNNTSGVVAEPNFTEPSLFPDDFEDLLDRVMPPPATPDTDPQPFEFDLQDAAQGGARAPQNAPLAGYNQPAPTVQLAPTGSTMTQPRHYQPVPNPAPAAMQAIALQNAYQQPQAAKQWVPTAPVANMKRPSPTEEPAESEPPKRKRGRPLGSKDTKPRVSKKEKDELRKALEERGEQRGRGRPRNDLRPAGIDKEGHEEQKARWEKYHPDHN